jgi:hypothetical protein
MNSLYNSHIIWFYVRLVTTEINKPQYCFYAVVGACSKGVLRTGKAGCAKPCSVASPTKLLSGLTERTPTLRSGCCEFLVLLRFAQ